MSFTSAGTNPNDFAQVANETLFFVVVNAVTAVVVSVCIVVVVLIERNVTLLRTAQSNKLSCWTVLTVQFASAVLSAGSWVLGARRGNDLRGVQYCTVLRWIRIA